MNERTNLRRGGLVFVTYLLRLPGNENIRMSDFLRVDLIDKRINELTELLGSREKVLQVIQGGTDSGTWMHPLLAFEFARWIRSECVGRLIEDLVLSHITESSTQKSPKFITLPYYGKCQVRTRDSKIKASGRWTSREELLGIMPGDSILVAIDELSRIPDKTGGFSRLMYNVLCSKAIDVKYSFESDKKTYLMRDSGTGLIKIGKSNNPSIRESTLQSEKPSIDLLYICDELVETELHEKYSTQRVRGEWFRLSDDDLNKIVLDYCFIKSN